MSLAASHLKSEIKLIHSSYPDACILQAGPAPHNARESIASIVTHVCTLDYDHLLDAAFNEPAPSPPSNNKLFKLKELKAKRERERKGESEEEEKNTRATSSSPSPSSPSSLPPTSPDPSYSSVSVKHEFIPHSHTRATNIVSFGEDGARSTSVAGSVLYFQDPLTDTTETSEQRRVRMGVWQFCKAVCFHHTHLLTSLRVGDIAGVTAAIAAFALRHGPEDTLDAVKAMTQLHKKGQQWGDFVDNVAAIRRTLARDTDPDWKIGSQLLPGFVMRAMEEDNRFQVELSLLRCTVPPPGIDHIMVSLAFKARTLVKAPNPLTGHAAVAQPAPPPATPSKGGAGGGREPCRAFARDGNCKFHVPAEGRFCRHSHGEAADRQTALDRATFKSTGGKPPTKATGGKGKPGSRPPKAPDGCYRCASKLHSIDNCTEGPSAHLGAVATPPNLSATNPTDAATWSTLRAFATRLDERDKAAAALEAAASINGQAAFVTEPKIGPPSAYDEIRFLDDELANIFKGGAR
jgi:hypothetical protein